MAEEEDFVTFTDDNEMEMDYLEMDSPEPEPLEFYSHEARDSEANVVQIYGGGDNDDDYGDDDLKSREDDILQRTSSLPSSSAAAVSGTARRSSHSMDNQTRALMKQMQITIGELQNDLQQSRDENEKLMVAKETLIISYDTKIDELNCEIDEMQIESQQYQLRYSEINEELHELRSRQAENVSSGKENQELLMHLQNKEQNVMDLMIDLESANKQMSRLKNQQKDSAENTAKLQKMLITLKKDKSVIEKNCSSVLDKYDILNKQYRFEVNNLSERVAQLQRENEIYRQSLSSAEQEKQEMQNNFTEATLELLHDEMNSAHNDLADEAGAVRLTRISSSDMNRTSYDHAHADSMLEPDSPIPSSFVKQRYGSQTSLPDESLLQSLNGHDSFSLNAHHRKGSDMSVQSNYDAVDPIKLKQDIRDVVSEVMVSDIKTIIRQEMVQSNDSVNGDEISHKIDQLVQMTQDRRKKSVDLDAQREEEQAEQERLNIALKQFEESMTDILEKKVIANILSSAADRVAFENEMSAKIENVGENLKNTDAISDSLKETIQNQMTVFQIALENEIGSAVHENMQNVVNDKINGKLRENIKQDMTECLQSINMKNNEKMEVAERETPAMKMDDTTMKSMIEDAIGNVMSGKIDGFMDEFRKEVIPDIEAVFEQLSRDKSYAAAADDSVDDEKANSNHNELIAINEKLREEIGALKKEQSQHDRTLRSAATSKVHQVVKLQNLLDHMRNDNRLLQYKVEKYQEKFVQIKQQQDEQNNMNVVNKMWGYFGTASNATSYRNYNSNPAQHLST